MCDDQPDVPARPATRQGWKRRFAGARAQREKKHANENTGGHGRRASGECGAVATTSANELIVYHGWSTKPRSQRCNVLQDALNAKGHTWKDLAIPHNSGVNVSIVNMVTGGDPPNAFVTSDPHIFRDLAGLGLERDLTDYYNEIGATDGFFPIVRELSTVDGKMVKVPLFLHIDGMVYWNKDVAKKAGVDPTAWKSVDDMIADFPKVKDAGFVPAAVGGQAFQVGYLFHAMVAAIGGPEIYNSMYSETPGPDGVRYARSSQGHRSGAHILQ